MKGSMKWFFSFLVFVMGHPLVFAQPNVPDLVVAADGSGNFTSLQEAILTIRDYKPTRTTIYVKNGIYREKVVIPANKCDITIIGQSADSTILTWNDHAKINNMGTFKTYTLQILGSGIRLENLTIENNAEQLGQAVSLHVEGDRCELVGCRLLGNQDTLFTGNGSSRQYYRNCYIEGTTDFIFGPATAWFEQCIIHSKRNSYITAASTPQENPYGYVFHGCHLTADAGVDKVYLGRPWRAYAYTLFMNCEMDGHIVAEGWDNWRNAENEKSARYAEYRNVGPGANTAKRVSWSRQLGAKDVRVITLEKVMHRDSVWQPSYAH